jgi:hypothetical protein
MGPHHQQLEMGIQAKERQKKTKQLFTIPKYFRNNFHHAFGWTLLEIGSGS